MVTTEQVLVALILTTFAGLSTTVGALLAFLAPTSSKRFLGIGLGFSAGAMLAVSFLELLPQSIEDLDFFWANVWFFIGIIFIFMIDIAIPHIYKEEHDDHSILTKEISPDLEEQIEIHRIGLLAAVGIGVHNLPEGLVTFAGTLQSIELGMVLALAIALHNIPEGLSVSIPLQAATHDKKYAFKMSFLSGLAEPVGALLAATIFLPFLTAELLGAILAFVAGIMVFITFDELLPGAKKASDSHLVSLGIIFGMFIMVFTLWVFSI